MSRRDAEILGHNMSSICDREGRLFCRVWVSSIFEPEAAYILIQSLCLLLDDLYKKKLSLFSTLSLMHKSRMSWRYFLKT